jgi:hypothetical protein
MINTHETIYIAFQTALPAENIELNRAVQKMAAK